MKKHLVAAGAAVLALGLTVSIASAAAPPCAPGLAHPSKAKGLKSSLTTAFVSCGNLGGATANSATEGGVPGCQPVETFHQAAGSPATGWEWGVKGKGDVSVTASKNKVSNILNPPGDTSDLAISLKMGGIEDSLGIADGTNGTLATVARATLNDRALQPAANYISVVDFPAGFPITVLGGKIKLKTSANVLLNGIGQPGLPPCSSIEVVSILVIDPEGNPFATLGAFLPSL